MTVDFLYQLRRISDSSTGNSVSVGVKYDALYTVSVIRSQPLDDCRDGWHISRRKKTENDCASLLGTAIWGEFSY